MDAIPMEKIERLWMAGEIDVLLDLIISETDLTHDEAKRVLTFFEKYEGDKKHDYIDDHSKYDGSTQRESSQHDYVEAYDAPYYDNSNEKILEQRIAELEEENQQLKIEISEFEERLSELNEVIMEQVRYIYEWVTIQ